MERGVIMQVPAPHARAGPSAPGFGGLVFMVSSLFWPRAFILAWWIFSDLLGRTYDSWIVPVVGFVVAPWTTLVYAMMWGRSSDGVFGWEWAVVAGAVALDVATWMEGRRLRRA
jgi:hypothetical protein